MRLFQKYRDWSHSPAQIPYSDVLFTRVQATFADPNVLLLRSRNITVHDTVNEYEGVEAAYAKATCHFHHHLPDANTDCLLHE